MKFISLYSRKTGSGKFIPEIDGLRFVAIITVVLFHLNTSISKELGWNLNQTFESLGGTTSPFSFGWWFVRLDLGVKVFFAISGFVLALPFLKYFLNLGGPEISLSNYFIRRLSRLEPPFILSMVIFSAVHFFLLGRGGGPLLIDLGAGLIYCHVLIFGEPNPINPVTWSLETEAQFYLLVPVIMSIIFFHQKTIINLLIISTLILGSIYFRKEFSFSPRWGQSILVYFTNFATGILVCWFYLKNMNWFGSKSRVFDFLGLLGIFGLFYFYKPQHHIDNQILFNFSLALVMVAAFKGRSLNYFFSCSLVYTLGGMCYSIYLLHYAFFHLSVKFTKFLWLDSIGYIGNLGLQILVNLPLVLIISSVFFRYCERPFMEKDWWKRFLKR
jgi:peptidoglycan/LPS O-acetylase OafA/YrhL